MEKDFDVIDTDLLKCFEQLSLDLEHTYASNNGECTIDCKACKNKSQLFDFSASDFVITENDFIISESDFNINVKQEDDDKISTENVSLLSANEEKVPLAFIKEEELHKEDKKEELNYEIKSKPLTDSSFVKEEELEDEVKSEPFTDSSSSDDENYVSLIERGGKEVTKRSHHRKPYRPKPHISRSEFESGRLYHYSSGYIVENNSGNLSSSSSETSCNVTVVNENRYIPNIGSPESGYDTSQSNAHSPSPPSVVSVSPPVYYDKETKEDKEKKIMEIINSFHEVEKKVYQKSKLQPNSTIYDSSCTGIQNVNGAKEVLVNANIAGNFENESASSIYSDSDFVSIDNSRFQNTDENRSASSIYSNSDFVNIANFNIQNTGENGCTSTASSDKDFVSIVNFQVPTPDENECASSAYSDNDFASIANIQFQNTDEDLLFNYFLDLQDLLINQSTSEATDFGLEASELVANQNPILCSRSTGQEEGCRRKLIPDIKDSTARKALRNSFNFEKYHMEEGEMLRRIKRQTKMKGTFQIIDLEEREQYKNLNQTLH